MIEREFRAQWERIGQQLSKEVYKRLADLRAAQLAVAVVPRKVDVCTTLKVVNGAR